MLKNLFWSMRSRMSLKLKWWIPIVIFVTEVELYERGEPIHQSVSL